MTVKAAVPPYSRNRNRGRAGRNRRSSHIMASTVETRSGREDSVSQDHGAMYSHLRERLRTDNQAHCCFESWRRRERQIRRTLWGGLIVFATFKMISAMILAAIYVVLNISSEDVISDLQNPLPIYLSAAMVAVSGLCDIILSKFHSAYMILTGVFFSISSCVLTLAGLLSAATVSLPKFSSFIHFQYSPDSRICKAYTKWDIQPNGSFNGGIVFNDLPGCSFIESTIPPLTASLVAFYGVACFTSFVVCFMLSSLLCLPEKDKRQERIRKASASSYINYDFELDHICDDVPLDRPETVATRNTTEPQGFLPGVAIPYYTLPYRLPLLRCQHPSETSDDSSSLTRQESKITSCRCNESSIKTVASLSSRPRVTSATTTNPRRPNNHRPVLPVEFRCVNGAVHSSMLSGESHSSSHRPLAVEGNLERHDSHHSMALKYNLLDTRDESTSGPSNNDPLNDSADLVEKSHPPPPYTELPAYYLQRTKENTAVTKSSRTGNTSSTHEETIL